MHVVLSAQRIDADAAAADVAGGHGQVGDGHDRGRTLRVFGDAEAVIDRRIAAGREQARGAADLIGRHAGFGCGRQGAKRHALHHGRR